MVEANLSLQSEQHDCVISGNIQENKRKLPSWKTRTIWHGSLAFTGFSDAVEGKLK